MNAMKVFNEAIRTVSRKTITKLFLQILIAAAIVLMMNTIANAFYFDVANTSKKYRVSYVQLKTSVWRPTSDPYTWFSRTLETCLEQYPPTTHYDFSENIGGCCLSNYTIEFSFRYKSTKYGVPTEEDVLSGRCYWGYPGALECWNHRVTVTFDADGHPTCSLSSF